MRESGREEEDRHLSLGDRKEQQKKNPFSRRNQGLNLVSVVYQPVPAQVPAQVVLLFNGPGTF